jgi:3-isopropylmalate/(R)-2-methylmalate dehydratase small subunit
MDAFTTLTGIAAPLPLANVDTDKIIPARFLKTIKRTGLGVNLFDGLRYDETGAERPDFVLNQEPWRRAEILIAHENFGCGSSREHAPQALYRYGFRAIIAESFAEIFFGNSTTLGIPCVVASQADIAAIAALVEANPQAEVTVDVTEGKVSIADMDFPATLPEHAREVLVGGKWDAIADLLEGIPAVKETAAHLPYTQTA